MGGLCRCTSNVLGRRQLVSTVHSSPDAHRVVTNRPASAKGRFSARDPLSARNLELMGVQAFPQDPTHLHHLVSAKVHRHWTTNLYKCPALVLLEAANPQLPSDP